MIRRSILILAAACASPQLATCQETASPAEMHFRAENVEGRHPAVVLLAQSRALHLSEAQVAGLREIHTRLRAQNRELWASVAEHARLEGERDLRSAATEREGARNTAYSAHEARAQIRENARRAAEEALGLLTEAQRVQLMSLENP